MRDRVRVTYRRSGAILVFANCALGIGIAVLSIGFGGRVGNTGRAPCAPQNPVLEGPVRSVATVATHVRVALFLKQRLVESTPGDESRATATEPENEQEVLEPASPRPLCELINLLRLHRIWGTAAGIARLGCAATVG
jgi:hypothetical protein